MAQSVISQFLYELRQGIFPSNSVHNVFESLRPKMTADEAAEAIALIATIDASPDHEKKFKGLDYLSLVPDGWLKDYLLFSQVSESPDSFHFYSAITCLTHMIGRRVFYPNGLDKILSPISVFLVSPAGGARRSTAARAAVQIAEEAGASILQDQATPEGLINFLYENNYGLLVADETATLLSKRDYMADIPAVLCSLLDCPRRYQRTMMKGTITLENPTLNALITCAPEWITQAMPSTALGGGLFSRLLLVYEPHKKRLIPRPSEIINYEDLEIMQQKLSTDLRTLSSSLSGQFTLTKEAGRLFDDFYAMNEASHNRATEKMKPYFSRKGTHLIRLTMALALSQNKLEGSYEDMDRALTLLTGLEFGMEIAYRQAGLEKPGRLQQRVINSIKSSNGRIDRSDLLRKVSDVMSSKEMDDIIVSLCEMGILKSPRRELKTRAVGPDTMVWIYELTGG